MIGAPCCRRLSREKKQQVERPFLSLLLLCLFVLFFLLCDSQEEGGKNSLSLSLSLSLSPSYFSDVLLHPVVVPVDAVAPDVGLLGDEDPGLSWVCVFFAGRERERERGGKEKSKEKVSQKRGRRQRERSPPSLSLSFVLSRFVLSRFVLSLSVCPRIPYHSR